MCYTVDGCKIEGVKEMTKARSFTINNEELQAIDEIAKTFSLSRSALFNKLFSAFFENEENPVQQLMMLPIFEGSEVSYNVKINCTLQEETNEKMLNLPKQTGLPMFFVVNKILNIAIWKTKADLLRYLYGGERE